MKRYAVAVLVAITAAVGVTAEPAQAQTNTAAFRARMKARCGDGARWYCKGITDAYCFGTSCGGAYVEGDIFAGSRTCLVTGSASGGVVRSYSDSCHR